VSFAGYDAAVAQSGQSTASIEQEIVAEKAATLGRAGERLQAALEALARVDTEIAAGGGGLADRRQELRADAAEKLWFLIVQREAIGLGHHEGIYQFYRVPRELRAVAGPRKRRG
jgi:hypothetical protein